MLFQSKLKFYKHFIHCHDAHKLPSLHHFGKQFCHVPLIKIPQTHTNMPPLPLYTHTNKQPTQTQSRLAGLDGRPELLHLQFSPTTFEDNLICQKQRHPHLCSWTRSFSLVMEERSRFPRKLKRSVAILQKIFFIIFSFSFSNVGLHVKISELLLMKVSKVLLFDIDNWTNNFGNITSWESGLIRWHLKKTLFTQFNHSKAVSQLPAARSTKLNSKIVWIFPGFSKIYF